MSQKKKPHQLAVAPAVPPQAAAVPAAERVRRILLGLVTALIVARPLVVGEDPGMLSRHTGSSHLILTLSWFLVAVGWAVWRWWANSTAWHGGLTEAALLVASVFVAASSTVASYKHPAILIAWEWFALFLGLFLMRQLAATASDRRYLMAVFLASVVSLSAYAVFQTRVEFPAMRQNQSLTGIRELDVTPRQAAALCGNGAAGPLVAAGLFYRIAVEQGDTRRSERDPGTELARKLEQGHAFGTFAQPSSFAAYLVLFLPALAIATFLRVRDAQGTWETPVSAACVLLCAFALLLTGRGQGGMLGLAIAGWAAFFASRRTIGPARLLLLLATGFAVWGVIQLKQGSGQFSDTWASAWAMIQEHPWRGVGAGNFGRLQPQFFPEGASEVVNDPGNLVLELWATAGVFALLGVVVSLGAFFWNVLRRPPETAEPAQPDPAMPKDGDRPRWEFYLWGMAGLLLGFILRRIGQSPEEILQRNQDADDLLIESVVTAFRAIIWFGAFALFESVRWPGRTLSAALAIGIAGALAQLSFSGGISYPSVAGPLWLAAGLALAGLERQPHTTAAKSWLALVAPLPLALGFLFAFVLYPFDPVMTAMSKARSTSLAVQRLAEDNASNAPKVTDVKKYLNSRVIGPLVDATREDPGDARWFAQLSLWYSRLWQLHWDSTRRANPRRLADDLKQAREFAELAVKTALEAQALDPNSLQGHLALYDLRMRFAVREQKVEGKQNQLRNAVAALRRLALADQSDPWVHLKLAQTLLEMQEKQEAREAAETALYWDDLARHPSRKLGVWQRYQVEQLAQPASAAPK